MSLFTAVVVTVLPIYNAHPCIIHTVIKILTTFNFEKKNLKRKERKIAVLKTLSVHPLLYNLSNYQYFCKTTKKLNPGCATERARNNFITCQT